jgi:hypothetical protein
MRTIEEIDVELGAYYKAWLHDKSNEAMREYTDELMRERCRAMGLSEDEIAGITQESKDLLAELGQAIAAAMRKSDLPR